MKASYNFILCPNKNAFSKTLSGKTRYTHHSRSKYILILILLPAFLFISTIANAVTPHMSAEAVHKVGLRTDGTVVAIERNNYGQLNTESWTDIQQGAAEHCHTVGLRSDGTVVAVEWNDYGQCNVYDWNLISDESNPFPWILFYPAFIRSAIPNSVEIIINDMKLPHAGRPHGVPTSYDWALRPRIGMGNNPGTFRAMVAWGQLYEDINGNPATNTRVQLRDIKAYMLSTRDNRWHLLQSSRLVEGAAFREDYVDNINKSADIRYEGDGSISVTAGGGYNFHFWTPTRTSIDPTDIAGIFTTVQARLVINNPSQADDRSQARYLLDMGGDYWLDLMAQWDYWKTNGDIGIGRFKYVTTGWQSFNMITLSEDKIRRNPPPLE